MAAAKLIAAQYILHGAKYYAPGEELSTKDAELMQCWLLSGAARLVKTEEPAKKKGKATLQTAEPGLPGKSSDGDPEALTGKVPKTPQREKAPRKKG